jgi:hypothetical protein
VALGFLQVAGDLLAAQEKTTNLPLVFKINIMMEERGFCWLQALIWLHQNQTANFPFRSK